MVAGEGPLFFEIPSLERSLDALPGTLEHHTLLITLPASLGTSQVEQSLQAE